MEQRAREKAAAEPERRNYQHILPEMNMSATHYKDMLTIHEEEYTRDWYWPSGKYGAQVQEVRVRVTPVPLLRKYDDMQLIGFIHEGPLRTPYRGIAAITRHVSVLSSSLQTLVSTELIMSHSSVVPSWLTRAGGTTQIWFENVCFPKLSNYNFIIDLSCPFLVSLL